jgi:hypothetical protein
MMSAKFQTPRCYKDINKQTLSEPGVLTSGFSFKKKWNCGRSGDCAGLKIQRNGFDTHRFHKHSKMLITFRKNILRYENF